MKLSIIKQLVYAFYVDASGPSQLSMIYPGEMIYNGVLELIEVTMGARAAKLFADTVDATDGSFYLNFSPTGEEQLTDDQQTAVFEEFWNKMLECSTAQSDNELLLKIGGFSREKDNNGQIVLYTDLMEKDGVIVPFDEEDDNES